LLAGMWRGTAIVENSMEIPQTIEHKLRFMTEIALLGMYTYVFVLHVCVGNNSQKVEIGQVSIKRWMELGAGGSHL
jgi:hypothetical protein